MTDAFGARTRKEHLIADPCEKWWAQTTSLLRSLALSKEGQKEATTEGWRKAAKKQKETIQETCAEMGGPPQFARLAAKDADLYNKWGRKWKLQRKTWPTNPLCS